MRNRLKCRIFQRYLAEVNFFSLIFIICTLLLCAVTACGRSDLWEIANSKGTNLSAAVISLNKTTTTIAIGYSEFLFAIITPSQFADTPVTWETDNETVASVTAGGAVTGVAEGVAVITATIEGGISARCEVTVIDKGYAGSITVTVSYSGSLGSVSADSPILVALSNKYFDKGILQGSVLTSSGSSCTFLNLSPGSYQVIAIYDVDNDMSFSDNRSPEPTDPIEVYDNKQADFMSGSIDATDIIVDKSNVAITIDMDDSLLNILEFTSASVAIDGSFGEWASIPAAATDEQNDSLGGYANDDLEYVKVASDTDNYYFMIKMYEDFSSNYDGAFGVYINYAIGSSLTTLNEFSVRCYWNGLGEIQGEVYGNPDDVHLSGSLPSLAKIGSGAEASCAEIRIPRSIIGSPSKIQGVYTYFYNQGLNNTGKEMADSIKSFSEK